MGPSKPMIPDYDRNYRAYHHDVYLMHSVDPRVLWHEFLSKLAGDLNINLPPDAKADKLVDLYILPNFFIEDVHCVGFSYHGYERGRECFMPMEYGVGAVGSEFEKRFEKEMLKMEWGSPGHGGVWKEANRSFVALDKKVKEEEEAEAEEKRAKERREEMQTSADGCRPVVFYERVDENDHWKGLCRYEWVPPQKTDVLESILEGGRDMDGDDRESGRKGNRESVRIRSEKGLSSYEMNEAEIDNQVDTVNHGKIHHEKERLIDLSCRRKGG